MSLYLGDINHTLTPINDVGGVGNYKCVSNSNGVYVYRRNGNVNHANKDIKFVSTAGTYGEWQDVGTSYPTKFGTSSTDGTAIEWPPGTATSLFFYSNNTYQCEMINDDPVSTNPPGTLSVVPTEFTQSVPSGVNAVRDALDFGRQLYYTIAAAANSGVYNIYIDDAYYVSKTHTNGTVSAAQIAGEQYGQNWKMYFGEVFTSSSLNTLVAEFTFPTKKVFTNFW